MFTSPAVVSGDAERSTPISVRYVSSKPISSVMLRRPNALWSKTTSILTVSPASSTTLDAEIYTSLTKEIGTIGSCPVTLACNCNGKFTTIMQSITSKQSICFKLCLFNFIFVCILSVVLLRG